MNATSDRTSLERFSDRAINYAKYRPSYPPAAIDFILEGLVNTLVAADIGAGTGIASRLLAQREVRVLAMPYGKASLTNRMRQCDKLPNPIL